MGDGARFIEKCLNTEVKLEPWPYQLIENTLSAETFANLKQQCNEKLNFKTSELHHIFPKDFKDWNIDFYDETVDICTNLLQSETQILSVSRS